MIDIYSPIFRRFGSAGVPSPLSRYFSHSLTVDNDRICMQFTGFDCLDLNLDHTCNNYWCFIITRSYFPIIQKWKCYGFSLMMMMIIIIIIIIIIYFENALFFQAKLGLDVCPYEVPPHIPESQALSCPVAYLGFQKGGPNFCWPLVLTQRRPNYVFQFFPMVKKNFFCLWGPWPNGPLKYATVHVIIHTFSPSFPIPPYISSLPSSPFYRSIPNHEINPNIRARVNFNLE